jgi:hypothetical protein
MEGSNKVDFRGIVCKDSDRIRKQIPEQNLLRKLGGVPDEIVWTEVEPCLRRYKLSLYALSARNAYGLELGER